MPQLIAFLRVKVGRLIGARESVRDLAQSVCREVLEDMDDFEYAGDAAFRSWLFQQASRKILDRHRYLRRARRYSQHVRELDPKAGREHFLRIGMGKI